MTPAASTPVDNKQYDLSAEEYKELLGKPNALLGSGMRLKVPLARPSLGREEERLVLQVLRSGHLSQGPVLRLFERRFASYLGVEHAVAVDNGTNALHLALLTHGLKGGDEVITTPFTFIATLNTILYVGAKPVCVDIDRNTYNMDPEQLRKAVTKKTRAVVAVHVFGVPCDMRPIIETCDEKTLILIEDACEALGSTYQGKKIGTFGDSCFSFYPNKPITTGEGGMICTNNNHRARLARALRNQGRMARGWLRHELVGYNYRLSDIHAALGLAQLGKLGAILRKRRKLAETYTILLKAVPEVRTPLNVEGRSWFVYVAEVENRDRIARRLERKGIECKPYFPSAHLQPPYKKLGFREGSYPVCEEVSKKVLALPFYNAMSLRDVKHVVRQLKQAVEKT